MKNETLANRLAKILVLLNQGQRLDLEKLSDEFGVSLRTIQRDIERLDFLNWEEKGNNRYKLNRQSYGILNQQDVERFARFASVADLFPKIDQDFYQEKLTESVQVKGIEYEDISTRQKDFGLIRTAIEQHQFIHFCYTKCGEKSGNFRQIAPYALTNKNGIWYVIGTENDKQKTFCFNQISLLKMLDETFTPNQTLIEQIKNNDSLSHGNQLAEVTIQVSTFATPYFLRRNLLPNQKIIHQTKDKELIISCENVNEWDIIPAVQYWIPHLTVISPQGLQEKIFENLQRYMDKPNGEKK
ncbi:helix-turn-helix transcriptional regulator [Lonepinella sp. MS14436]|uniref:helix-turn-helix transcriptional regulator n=1 Tax=Lonepinella sp. MS14436 TaxID=3003619 RepID=UPI0036D83AE6